ncbi:MAG: hypothetical protein HRU38_25245, partial [Saccharospirillaceae bacterium]|nr:hypothetical protein [Pseudomonadales bacterium]NRB81923.1 hypothetical protein [Saccharospirillaceae bacterium]
MNNNKQSSSPVSSRIVSSPLIIPLLTLAITLGFVSCLNKEKEPDKTTKNHTLNSYLQYPEPLVAKAPFDIDLKLKESLDNQKKFVEVQRLFEIVSWQNFIALNWPVSSSGQPKAIMSDKGRYPWQDWKESYEVYLTDGSTPKPWGTHSLPSGFTMENQNNSPIISRTSRGDLQNGANVEDEFKQAFTDAIWDQNGNLVRYQVMMNQSEFDYIVNNELYNIEGQVAFSKNNPTIIFPSNSREKEGATEIKLAWKQMDPSVDIPERFLTVEAYVTDEKGEYSIKTMGLVGMHIAMKTISSPQWTWATFEHVDNVQANSLKYVNGKQVQASFNDPTCDICPINVFPNLSGDYSNSTIKKNQIQRVVPISKETQALNKQVQKL